MLLSRASCEHRKKSEFNQKHVLNIFFLFHLHKCVWLYYSKMVVLLVTDSCIFVGVVPLPSKQQCIDCGSANPANSVRPVIFVVFIVCEYV